MSRLPARRRLLAAGSLVLVLGCRATEPSPPPSPAPPPAEGADLVLISIDTLRADRLGSYGYDRPTSPALDALAAESVRFANAFAESSWTLPSHITLFTGLHPTSHGVTLEEHQLAESISTLAERFREAGYQTYGNTAGGLLSARYGFGRGFDRFDDEFKVLERGVAETIEAVEAADPDRPFFAFLHTYDVHCPYDPPEEYARRFRTRPPHDHLEVAGKCGNPHFNQLDLGPGQLRFLSDQYDAGIRAADDRLAGLLAHLRARDRWDQTIVAVLSDHGEELGEHGRIGHERTLFVETLRVPLILRVPGVPPRVLPDLVGLVDVAPTLLELVGAPPLDPQRGSLVRRMTGAAREEDPQRAAFSELERHVRLRSVVHDDHHLIVDLADPERPLVFDLAADPREQHVLAGERFVGRTARRLGRLLSAHLRTLPAPPTTHSAPLDPELARQLRALGYL